MVSDIPRVSVFGHCPYLVTFLYVRNLILHISEKDRKYYYSTIVPECIFNNELNTKCTSTTIT